MTLGRLEAGAWAALGTYGLLAVAFQTLPKSLPVIPLLSVFLAALALAVVIMLRRPMSRTAGRLAEAVQSVPASSWLAGTLLLGVALRVAFAAGVQPEWVSDPLTYWQYTAHLADTGVYGMDGKRAFWPPGMVFYLYPVVKLFGPQVWLPLVMNLVLFAATSLVIWRLGRLYLDGAAARVGVLLLAIWPNMIIMSASPQKELLCAFLLIAAILAYAEARRFSALSNWRPIALLMAAGFCLGSSALTQPATALFGLVFAVHELITRESVRTGFSRLALAGTICILTVLPWTVRNYMVFDALVPINTAGGVVFSSANNDHATGGWIAPNLYIDDEWRAMDELGFNREGFARGLAWIEGHKAQFAKLILLKQTRLLCCDDSGASISFLNPQLTQPDPAAYDRATAVAQAFWIVLLLGVLIAGVLHLRRSDADARQSIVLLLACLYFIAMFSVFQSEGRHHVSFAPVLAILASAAFARPRAA